jgi:hypothetical protein
MLFTLSCFSLQRFHEFFSGSMESTLFLVVFNRDFMIAQYRLIDSGLGTIKQFDVFDIFNIFH